MFQWSQKIKFILQKNRTNVSTYKIQKLLQRQKPFSLDKPDKPEKSLQEVPL